MRTLVLCLSVALLGCDVNRYLVTPAQPPPDDEIPPTQTEPFAYLQPDRPTTSEAVGVEGSGEGSAEGRDAVWIRPVALWILPPETVNNHATAVDLLIQVDPRSNPELLEVDQGAWCPGSPVEVTPTGNPGEWRLERSPGDGDCTCDDPYGSDTALRFQLGGLHLRFHTSGQWRVELAPASSTPICECERGCLTGLPLFGGTITVSLP